MWVPTQLFVLGRRSVPTTLRIAGLVGLLGALSDDGLTAHCHEDSAACGCRRNRDDLEAFLRQQPQQQQQHQQQRGQKLGVDWDALPVYTSQQVARHDGTRQSSVWMSYGGFVYDVTTFVPVHPGGTARIRRAAGAAMEPYWHLHTQHFRTEEPLQILSRLVVGRLADADQEQIDARVEEMEGRMDSFRLSCRVGRGMRHSYSMADLQRFTRTDRTSRVGCESKGGPVQTSLFGGVLLRDLGRALGVKNMTDYELVLQAMDGEVVNVNLGDENVAPDEILIAYEENGAPLSQGRGFPLRVIIPGKRVVKWVDQIHFKTLG